MYPVLRIKKHHEKRVLSGHPWIYSNELEKSSAQIEAGELVTIETYNGQYIGNGYYNQKSLIACRLLSRDKNAKIDKKFFVEKIKAAAFLREKFFEKPYYRLVHSEADFIPGIIIDRFGDTVVCQINTAGMEKLKNYIIDAIEELLSPQNIILRNDTPSRNFEGLEQYTETVKGKINNPIKVYENGIWYYADVMNGQKTGWFYDQRENRKFAASLVNGKTVLDTYCHSGGFGILAAKNNAKSVTFVDSSETALKLAEENAKLNSVSEKCSFAEGKIFDELEKMIAGKKQFDVVITDPPAFIKSRKDLNSGLRGYEKLARLASQIVSPDGFMFIFSCSHNASREDFLNSVASGVNKAGRYARIVRVSGADIDHPLQPALPESEYLKAILLQINPE